MVSFYIKAPEFPDPYSVKVRLSVAVLGMAYSVSFFLVCDWLYRGMERLKRGYLAGTSLEDRTGDRKQYYFHTSVLGEGRIGQIIPRALPLLTFLFWAWLIVLEARRLGWI